MNLHLLIFNSFRARHIKSNYQQFIFILSTNRIPKTLGHDLNDQQLLICQLPGKYGGFGLRSGKIIAGAQHVMSLEKCESDMSAHTEGWDLAESAKNEAWLKDCLGATFSLENYFQLKLRAVFHEKR